MKILCLAHQRSQIKEGTSCDDVAFKECGPTLISIKLWEANESDISTGGRRRRKKPPSPRIHNQNDGTYSNSVSTLSWQVFIDFDRVLLLDNSNTTSLGAAKTKVTKRSINGDPKANLI
jgi:hypothetical protein